MVLVVCEGSSAHGGQEKLSTITRTLKNPDPVYPSIRNLARGSKDHTENLCWLFVGYNPMLGPQRDSPCDHQDQRDRLSTRMPAPRGRQRLARLAKWPPVPCKTCQVTASALQDLPSGRQRLATRLAKDAHVRGGSLGLWHDARAGCEGPASALVRRTPRVLRRACAFRSRFAVGSLSLAVCFA